MQRMQKNHQKSQKDGWTEFTIQMLGNDTRLRGSRDDVSRGSIPLSFLPITFSRLHLHPTPPTSTPSAPLLFHTLIPTLGNRNSLPTRRSQLIQRFGCGNQISFLNFANETPAPKSGARVKI